MVSLWEACRFENTESSFLRSIINFNVCFEKQEIKADSSSTAPTRTVLRKDLLGRGRRGRHRLDVRKGSQPKAKRFQSLASLRSVLEQGHRSSQSRFIPSPPTKAVSLPHRWVHNAIANLIADLGTEWAAIVPSSADPSRPHHDWRAGADP